ncbi:MAG: hypothetical protein MUP14_05270 [Dehalococcoidia bacterium]|nr:hypothetical protein [Dehalococcoidia bacterium]
MAIVGRKPKPEDQRRNQNKPRHDWIEVERRSYRGGPNLPDTQPTGLPWPDRTKDWWAIVRRMPHARLWTKADWGFALDTALVAAHFHGGELGAAVELRQREKILGTTMDARRDLRIRYIEPRPEEERAGVTAIADYRKALEE